MSLTLLSSMLGELFMLHSLTLFSFCFSLIFFYSGTMCKPHKMTLPDQYLFAVLSSSAAHRTAGANWLWLWVGHVLSMAEVRASADSSHPPSSTCARNTSRCVFQKPHFPKTCTVPFRVLTPQKIQFWLRAVLTLPPRLLTVIRPALSLQ